MSKCDTCRFQLEKGKCNSFMVMAMTMASTHENYPGFRKMTDKEIDCITELDFCMGYEAKEEEAK